MSGTYELPTFLNAPVAPVELITELDRLEIDPANRASIHLLCKTLRYSPSFQDYYGTKVETLHQPPVPGTPALVQLDFCSDEIIRIRYVRGLTVSDVETPMLLGRFDGVPVSVEEHAGGATLRTKTLRVEITREPFQISIYDLNSRLIWQTRAVDIEGLRRPDVQWNPNEQRWIFYHRYAYPLGSLDHGDRRHAFLSLDLRYDEHIYGFGESFGRFDKRDTLQVLWNQEAFGNASPASYKRVPFFCSTRGYGLFIHTANAVRCRVGDLEHTALSLIVDNTAALDVFFIYGSSLKAILPRYTSITGAPALPPKWTFGLWMARISYNRQAQVEAVADKLREHAIPCDVIHIDTDWYKRDWECDLEFCPDKFPDPAGMMARLRERGFRVSLWQWPNIVITSSMFNEAREGGYLATRLNGQPYLYSGFVPDAGFIDYSNPAAVEWIKGKFRKLFDLGVAAIKVDFGEGAPPDAQYHAAASEAMHNLYPLLYGGAIHDVTQETQGEGKAVIWARAAWAGSQRYPVHWSGDGIARFEDMACVLRAALSFGMSGFPFYSHDIGGFSGLPSPELYIRWAQFGLFSSHARAHGTPPREPWEFGEQAETIFRKYAELRYRLLPYIYSEAVECARTSLPMVRPMALEFEHDPTTYTIDDQYMFGRSLLIAPIFDETNRRRIYLPRGTWYDFWTKQPQHGGQWYEVDAPLDVLPIYVRADTILPYAPLAQHSDAVRLDPLSLELYPLDGSMRCVIYDEGAPPITLSARPHKHRIQLEISPTPGDVEIAMHDLAAPVQRVRVNAREGITIEL
jgi:alpha-D-xyloside xylohydrolase